MTHESLKSTFLAGFVGEQSLLKKLVYESTTAFLLESFNADSIKCNDEANDIYCAFVQVLSDAEGKIVRCRGSYAHCITLPHDSMS